MKVAVFSTKQHTEDSFEEANAAFGHELAFLEPRLTVETAPLAKGFPVVCISMFDQADSSVLKVLRYGGTQLLALRCAGFNNVDLAAADELELRIVRVPAYSPHAVAEHTVGLMLALNRKTCRAYARAREGNPSLDGLLGFDMHGRTVGVIGTGRVGQVVAQILKGFGCTVLAFDPVENRKLRNVVKYVPLGDLLAVSDIVTLHCPLSPQTCRIIDKSAFEKMKQGVMLINTSRGALIDARAAIRALKSGRLGYLGLDIYEEEADMVFEDLSDTVIPEDVFARLLTFPNVIVTAHQAFFTAEGLRAIAESTLASIAAFQAGRSLSHEVTLEKVAR
jgi:D-lactate dehydrogenase